MTTVVKKQSRDRGKIAYTCAYFSVEESFVGPVEGKRRKYFIVKRHSESVVIVPVYKGRILFQKQNRFTTGVCSWELPAGAIEAGEDIAIAAKRELVEETGLSPLHFVKVGRLQEANGFSDSFATIFYARIQQRDSLRLPDRRDEDILEFRWWTWAQAWHHVSQGLISDSLSIASLALAAGATGSRDRKTLVSRR